MVIHGATLTGNPTCVRKAVKRKAGARSASKRENVGGPGRRAGEALVTPPCSSRSSRIRVASRGGALTGVPSGAESCRPLSWLDSALDGARPRELSDTQVVGGLQVEPRASISRRRAVSGVTPRRSSATSLMREAGTPSRLARAFTLILRFQIILPQHLTWMYGAHAIPEAHSVLLSDSRQSRHPPGLTPSSESTRATAR